MLFNIHIYHRNLLAGVVQYPHMSCDFGRILNIHMFHHVRRFFQYAHCSSSLAGFPECLQLLAEQITDVQTSEHVWVIFMDLSSERWEKLTLPTNRISGELDWCCFFPWIFSDDLMVWPTFPMRTRHSTWKVDGATPMYCLIIIPYTSKFLGVAIAIYFHYGVIERWVFPKIGVPPKWMVYNGKNPLLKWMILGGEYHYFRFNIQKKQHILGSFLEKCNDTTPSSQAIPKGTNLIDHDGWSRLWLVKRWKDRWQGKWTRSVYILFWCWCDIQRSLWLYLSFIWFMNFTIIRYGLIYAITSNN